MDLTYPTWERYVVLSHVISTLSIRDRRHIFQCIRTHTESVKDIFFPNVGITFSEFAVWHILGESKNINS